MRVIVGKHDISIESEAINEKELNITHCSFEFDEDITNDYNKIAYFTKGSSSYKVIIEDNECDIPNEVLNTPGKVELGVSYFKIEDNETTRYNPSSAYFYILKGSIKENTKNGLYITTPSELEQFENEIRDFIKEVNIDITVSKTDNVATVTTTDANGNHKSVEIYDGVDGKDGKDGQSGPKGDKGDDGQQGPQGPKGDKGDKGDTPDLSNYYTKAQTDTLLSTKENTSNKVTSISSASTDTQYPSAKCVYDIVGDINSALDTINGEVI